MEVLIVGTGAEGSWVGSRLSQAGIGTTYLAGTRQRVEELDRHGMIVRSPGDFFHSRVRAITHSEIAQTFDAVIIATRAHKGSFALAAARNAIRSSTLVLPLRFDPVQMSLLAESAIGVPIACVQNFTVNQLRDGSVKRAGRRTSLSIGSLGSPASAIGDVQNLFLHSEIRIEVSSDIRSEMWVSFVHSAAAGAIAILFPFDVAVYWTRSRQEAAFREAVREGIKVGLAAGIKLRGARASATRAHDVFDQGARVESAHNLMLLVRFAQDHGVSVPLLKQAYEKQFSEPDRLYDKL